MLHADVTGSIVDAFFDVHHELGHGFLEGVYERAMVIALAKSGLAVQCQVPIAVHYNGHVVGEYLADMIVERRVILELKACRVLEPTHEAQVINYLRATSIEIGLLLNFSAKPVVRRLILTNDRKPSFALRGLQRPSAVAVEARRS